MTDPTEQPKPADRPASPIAVSATATELPDLAAPSPSAERAPPEPDGPPFSLRLSLLRLKLQIEDALAHMTLVQFAIGLGVTILVLGLALLPRPSELAHMMVAVGAVILMLTAAFSAVDRAAIAQAVEPAAAAAHNEGLTDLVAGLERKIEQLKDTQWELSESESRYRDLLDAQEDVILRRDAQGRLTFVNQAFTRVFGIAGEAMLGKTFSPIVHEGEAAPAPVGLKGASADGAGRYTQRIETMRGSRWFAWEEQAIPATASATVSGPTSMAEARADRGPEVQCVGRDVTAARAHEAELAQARDAAQAASRAKSRFLAVMSHEIRTPMNGIMGMTSLLTETALTPEQQTYASAVGQSAKTLLGLIDEILDFSKIEAGRLDLRQAPFALDETVQGVVELLAPRAHDKGLEIAWRVAPSLPRFVVGDEARIRQILMNLAGNAIKFTDRGGVGVTVAAAGGSSPAGNPGAAPAADSSDAPDTVELVITVTDTGIGMPPAALATLFNEFEQVDASSGRRHAGTGLGLAISRHLAEAMGGSIDVESQLGAGSTFTVHVRLRRSQQGGTIAQNILRENVLRETSADESTPAVPRRVLLATAAPIEAEAMAATLTIYGCEVALTRLDNAGAMIAAATAKGRAFDVLMVDAGADPREAGQVLASLAAAVAGSAIATRGIVAMKAGERERLRMFRCEGFTGYLVRPVRSLSLLTQVGAVGQGAVCVPVVSEPQFSARSVPVTTSPPGRSVWPGWRPHVLLAEDNEIGALLARTMLDKSGCDVVRVRTGHEAVAAVQASLVQASLGATHARAFDLVLMDMHMPELDGLDATRAVQALYRPRHDRALATAAAGAEHPCAPPIVALTANAFAEDRAQCLEAGMVDHLAKPFMRPELLAILEKWCRPASIGRGHGLIEDDAA